MQRYSTWYSITYNQMHSNPSEAFEPLFHKYNVDIFFDGHVHLLSMVCSKQNQVHGYERNYAVFDSQVDTSYTNSQGTIHILSGSGGNVEGMDPWIAYSIIEPPWLGTQVCCHVHNSLFSISIC